MLTVSRWVSHVLPGIAACLSMFLMIRVLSAGPPTGLLAVLGLAWLGFGWTVSARIGVFVHECGHLLACLVLRVRVRVFRLARADRDAYQFRVGGVTVALGSPFAWQVEQDPVPSRGRAAVITLAGPLASLVVAGALLAVGLATAPHLSGTTQIPEDEAVEISMAALIAVTGISNLLPFRSKWGRLSDGATLLALGNGRLAQALRRDQTALKGPSRM